MSNLFFKADSVIFPLKRKFALNYNLSMSIATQIVQWLFTATYVHRITNSICQRLKKSRYNEASSIILLKRDGSYM